MCINCNIIAPMNHDVCDVLGLERNKYGLSSRSMEHLMYFLINFKYEAYKIDPHIEKLETFLKQEGLYEPLKEAAERGKGDRGWGLVDNSLFNFVLARYFEITNCTLGEGFFKSLKVPIELLTDAPERIGDRCFECTYEQILPIPRKVLESWKIGEAFVRETANKYDFKLLQEPFTDNEPDPQNDYVYADATERKSKPE